jgi:hypothetical protein
VQFSDEFSLSPDILSTGISDLSLADHRHRFKARQRSSCRLAGWCFDGRPDCGLDANGLDILPWLAYLTIDISEAWFVVGCTAR